MSYKVRLLDKYRDKIRNELKEKFSYQNPMQIPCLEKIIISRGVGAAVADKKLIEQAVEELTLIAGQKAVVCRSKRDISNFKLRKGMPIGAKVTLRSERMYEFLDRLINVAIPRMRDFRGLPVKGFDGRGNYTLGVKEQIIFVEIDVDKIYKIQGMDITFVTSSQTDEEAFALLSAFGMPFQKPQQTQTA
jgi:large subunit ribosomal protein L5